MTIHEQKMIEQARGLSRLDLLQAGWAFTTFGEYFEALRWFWVYSVLKNKLKLANKNKEREH